MEARQNFEVPPLTDEQIKEQIEPTPTNNPNDGIKSFLPTSWNNGWRWRNIG